METIGIVVLAAVMSGLAIWAGWNPRGIMAWFRGFWADGGRLGFVASVRAVIGLYLLWVSDSTPAPRIVAGLGIFFLLAALLVLALGRTRIDRMVDYWTDRSEATIRSLAVAWVAFAAFLFWAGLAPA